MRNLLGIDEVGRGPWAGPLVVGACILPKDEAENYPAWVEPLTDSKKLSKKKREEYSEIILRNALATGLGWVSAREIDELGLSDALRLATRRTVEEIKSKKVPFEEIIIDGITNFLSGTSLEPYVTTLKKADFLIKEVSAASIIAKVARDRYMESLAEKYPGYGFEKHVGYGTSAHRSALEKLGPCPEHRLSFSPVAMIGREKPRVPTRPEDKIPDSHPTSKMKGDRAETIVANFLEENGHKIVARNHKTKFYEIDIISTLNNKIYFTEVKYRKSEFRGTSLEMIDKKKLNQMSFAAESFLKLHPEYKTFSPLLAAASVSGEKFTLNDWFVIK